MSESSNWSELTLESVGCILLLVVAYKVYRMKVSTRSECCDGALRVLSDNPGNATPKALQRLGIAREDVEQGGERRYIHPLEGVGLTEEEIESIKKARLVRSEDLMLKASEAETKLMEQM